MSDCCSTESGSPDAASGGSSNSLCPNCGEAGRPVTVLTLKHMVRPEFLEVVNKAGVLFSRTADCAVVYFHPDGETLGRPDLRVRVGLKETDDPVPVCYCFGFTERMLLKEIRATGDTTIPQRVAAEMKAENCAGEVRNPQGTCCLGNVHAAVKRAQKFAAPVSKVL